MWVLLFIQRYKRGKLKDRGGKSLYTTSPSPQVAERRYKLRESCSWAIKLYKNHLLNVGETEWGDGVMGGFIRQTNSLQVRIEEQQMQNEDVWKGFLEKLKSDLPLERQMWIN